MIIITGLLGHLLLSLLHLIVIALDVVFFFLLVRCLATRWQVALFLAFDRIGSSVVDPLLHIVRPLGGSYQASFLAISLTLAVFRLGLVAIAHSFVAGV